MPSNIGKTSIKFTDNSAKVLATMKGAKEAVLTNIGIAAKRNVQRIITEKHIYDTGELHRTIDWGADGVIGKVPTESVDIGSPKDYAIFNEFGTSKMPARPFIQPGILENKDEYQRIAEQTIAEKFK